MTHSRTIEPSLDALKNQSFPQVAAALRTRSPRIMERWQDAVRELLPTAEELTLKQLRDHVPLLIDQLIEALASDQAGPTDRLVEVSKPHGEVRFHQDYNVNEVMIEYHLLRQILQKQVAEELGRPLSVTELAAINVGIDTAQRRGVVTFVEHLTAQLRAADELQSSYISHLNHDLRGGMNGILLMVEVLKRELSTEPRFAEATEDLEAMRRAVMDSVATMDRFVFAHRLSRGKLQARIVQIDVAKQVTEILAALKHESQDRKVQFIVEGPAECLIESDRDLMRLILHNVLSNAVKHARREGGNVTVQVHQHPGGGCDVQVTDQGPGIAPDQLEQLLSTLQPPKGKQGMKLGLSVSRMAAELIGVTFRIESVLGGGTTVYLSVPDKGKKG